MLDNFIKLIIGDMGEKRTYKQFNRKLKIRLEALPKEYQFAYRKIKQYLMNNGVADLMVFMDLVDLFETSTLDGRHVLDVIGSDVSKFCDELIGASATNSETPGEKLNREILEKLHKEVE